MRWFLMVLLLLPALVMAYTRAEREQAEAQVKQLIRDKQFEQALSVTRERWGSFPHILFDELALAERERRADDVLAYQAAYFRYFPFLQLDWDNQFMTFERMADKYLTAMARQPDRLTPEMKQNLDSRQAYTGIRAALVQRDRDAARRQAEAFIRQYPQSLYLPIAVLMLVRTPRAIITEGKWDRQQEELAFHLQHYRELLAVMQEVKAPARAHLAVMWAYTEAGLSGSNDTARKQVVLTYQEMAALDESPSRRRFLLLEAAFHAQFLFDEDGAEITRAICEDLLKKAPPPYDTAKARAGIVRSYLTMRRSDPDKALQAIRRFQREAPGEDFSPQLSAVAHALMRQRSDDCLAVLREIVERHPRSVMVPEACYYMGKLYQQRGDQPRARAMYRLAVETDLATLITPDSIQPFGEDAQMSISSAAKELALDAMARQQWAEALGWWEKYKPAGWCGNGMEGMSEEGSLQSAICLLKLGEDKRALALLDPWVFQPTLNNSPEIPIFLAEYYREHGGLAEFEQRVQEAMKKDQYIAARYVPEYLTLVRLADARDVAGLWKYLDDHAIGTFDEHPYARNWRTPIAARLLTDMPKVTTPFAMEQLRREDKPYSYLWAAVLLGKMKVGTALPLIEQRMNSEANVWCLTDYCYALALLGTEEAYAIIRRLAAGPEGNHRTAAETMLKRYPQAE